MSDRVKVHINTILLFASILAAALSGVVAQFLPLSKFPLVSDVVDSILSITFLPNVGLKSAFPDAARGYYIFAVPQALLAAWFLIRVLQKEQESKSASGLLTKNPSEFYWYHRIFLLLIFVPLSAVLSVLGWLGFVGENSRLFSIGSSLPCLLILGWVFPAGVGTLAAIFFGSVKKIILGRL